MWRTLVAKEMRAHLVSFRFLASFVILFVVVAVTAAVLTADYVAKLDEYSARQAEIDRYLRSYAHFNRIQNVLQPTQPPIPFQSLVRGLTADVNMEAFDDDPLPVMFPLIDLTFIVTILMSLVALILTYDAVSGEKEEGTLKLMLANSLPRSKLILAKVAGAGLTLVGPLVVSLAAGMLVVLLHPRVDWTGADWGALGLILVGADHLQRRLLAHRDPRLVGPPLERLVDHDLALRLDAPRPGRAQPQSLRGLVPLARAVADQGRPGDGPPDRRRSGRPRTQAHGRVPGPGPQGVPRARGEADGGRGQEAGRRGPRVPEGVTRPTARPSRGPGPRPTASRTRRPTRSTRTWTGRRPPRRSWRACSR